MVKLKVLSAWLWGELTNEITVTTKFETLCPFKKIVEH